MSNFTVPQLDLTPKLRRPLQLWNPLDYLRLLYWVFFFPQALRWYENTFVDPAYRDVKGREVWAALRADMRLRNLAFQGLLLSIGLALALAISLQSVGFSIKWPALLFSMVVLVGLFAAIIASISVIAGVTGAVPLALMFAVLAGLSDGALLYIVFFVFLLSTWLAVPSGVALGGLSVLMIVALFSLAFGLLDLVLGIIVSGGVLGLQFGMLSRLTGGTFSGALLGLLLLMFGSFVMALRLPEFLLSALLGRVQAGRVSRITLLPLPGLRAALQAWLSRDWAAGLANANQLLAHSLQFIPVVCALDATLAQLPAQQLLPAVALLARDPYDWRVLRCITVPFANLLGDAFMLGRVIFPERWLERLFPFTLRVDTPARAACAGFWLLHKQEVSPATAAFAELREISGGEGLYLSAHLLQRALLAQSAADVAVWLAEANALADLPRPRVRPAVIETLMRLRDVAAEADVALTAVSPLMRSTAIGRALANLTRLLAEVAETCPAPEAPLIEQVAAQWRDLLAATGGQLGEDVLRQPLVNPFSGYSGLPVVDTFVGRADILRRLEQLWTAGQGALPPIILHGHRRMGKTSILRHLCRHHSPEILIVYTDMQDLALADHTGELLYEFARGLWDAAQAAGLEPGPAPQLEACATLGAARRELNALLERLDGCVQGRRIILAVDEYELAEAKIAAGKFNPDFLRYLRSAAQSHRWLGLIFSGRQTLEDELRHYKAVFFGSAEPLKVSFFSRHDALQLIRCPADDFALDVELALADELYRLTYGQPYLLQRLCWELVNGWNERFLESGAQTSRVLTLADLDTLLTPTFYNDFYLQADYYFSGLWDEAGESSRKLMRALAQASAATLSRVALLESSGLTREAGEPALQAALRHDFILEEREGFRLAIPLLRRWLATDAGK